jgi:flavin reductase (DIM6/NTAB) family NADH-FMN oxidoreductase RutF
MRKFKDYGKDDLDQKTSHGLLLGGIGPRPIAWVSTVDTEGNVNLAPFSFFNLFSSNPPVLIFSPARKGRDNTIKHTLENLEQIPECVVNVVPYNLMQQMVLSSLEYPKGVDEFDKAGLKKLKSIDVKPPRVAESPMQLECKLIEIKKLGAQGGAGNLMICEVLRMHIADDVLDEKGWIDPYKIDLIGRMGGAWYSRANGTALFQIKSDVSVIGVGFESLPPEARTSKVLTGNELGVLASLHAIPDETQVNDFKLEIISDIFIDFQDSPEELLEALHRKSSSFIKEGKLLEAWMCLLSYNS